MERVLVLSRLVVVEAKEQEIEGTSLTWLSLLTTPGRQAAALKREQATHPCRLGVLGEY
jgi:hypothetical protein